MRDKIKEILVTNIDETHNGYEKAIDEILLLFDVNPSNLVIKSYRFKESNLTSDFHLELFGITKETIIQIVPCTDNNEEVLIYYWG
jgi:hypothetical protein